MTATHRIGGRESAPSLRFRLLALPLALLLGACSSAPSARLRVTPPAPLPAPITVVDVDRDGVPDERDPCPTAPEDGALPGSDDGCPKAAEAAPPPPVQAPSTRLQ